MSNKNTDDAKDADVTKPTKPTKQTVVEVRVLSTVTIAGVRYKSSAKKVEIDAAHVDHLVALGKIEKA